MIEISGQKYAFSDPLIILGLVAVAVVILIVVMLMVVVRSAGRSAAAAAPLANQMGILGQHVQQLNMGQAALPCGLQTALSYTPLTLPTLTFLYIPLVYVSLQNTTLHKTNISNHLHTSHPPH